MSRRLGAVWEGLRALTRVVTVTIGLLLIGGPGLAQRLPQVGPDLSPAEVQQLFDAFVLVLAQEALSLTDAQFGPFVTRLKQLQTTRRQTQQQNSVSCARCSSWRHVATPVTATLRRACRNWTNSGHTPPLRSGTPTPPSQTC